jgi:hypothetical protein
MAFFVTSCQHSSLRVYTFVKKTKSVGNSSFGFIAENLTIVPIKVLYMLLGQRSRVRFPPWSGNIFSLPGVDAHSE